MPPSQDTFSIARGRRLRALIVGRAHAMARDRSSRLHLWIGVPVVILTTIVGGAAFASLADLAKTHVWIAVGTGILSTFAAILSGLQIFLDFKDTARKHADVAARLNAMARMLEFVNLEQSTEQAIKAVRGLDTEYDAIIQGAPIVSTKLQEDAERLIQDKENPQKFKGWLDGYDDGNNRVVFHSEWNNPN